MRVENREQKNSEWKTESKKACVESENFLFDLEFFFNFQIYKKKFEIIN